MGCRVNQFDGGALGKSFQDEGYRAVDGAASADLIVLNTCTVTDASDREAYRMLRRFRSEAPGATIAVTGCLAQRDPEGVAARDEADLVLGTGAKRNATSIVRAFEEGSRLGKIHWDDLSTTDEVFFIPTDGLAFHTRAFLKIQEGCERSCSYCIIPTTRGRERSVPAVRVAEEVRRLHARGFPEFVLTGVHLGGYGRDLDPPGSFIALLRQLEEMSEDFRLRISSLEPMELDEEMIAFFAQSAKVVPHLHLPMQSGSTRVLTDMNRGYTAERYAELVELASSKIKRVQIGTDVIVGFPTEGAREFEETARLIENSPLAYLHVFPFSPRSGTPAAAFPLLPAEQVRERASRLRTVSAHRRRAFAESFVGTKLPVLTMTRSVDGSINGQTDNYIPVRVSSDLTPGVPLKRYVSLRMISFDGNHLMGAPFPA